MCFLCNAQLHIYENLKWSCWHAKKPTKAKVHEKFNGFACRLDGLLPNECFRPHSKHCELVSGLKGVVGGVNLDGGDLQIVNSFFFFFFAAGSLKLFSRTL